MPISLWAKTQSFLFPTRSSLVKEPEAVASAAAFPSAAKRELTPPGPACQQLFFEPRSFFSERAARVSPRRRSGNLSRPLLAVNRFLLLFSKNFFAPPCPASRPCPAQRDIPSRSGENGLCTSTPPLSTTFYFFTDFFLHPRQRPVDVWCLIRGSHMPSLITCRQLPSGVFTVIALWKRPRPRSARQRRVPEQT